MYGHPAKLCVLPHHESAILLCKFPRTPGKPSPCGLPAISLFVLHGYYVLLQLNLQPWYGCACTGYHDG